MAEVFDPYEKWLGIPKDKRPLTSYRLLGVEIFEGDQARITRRAERRIQLVTRQQKGKHGAIAKKVLKQLVEARDTLLDGAKKEKYDRMLRKRLGNGVPQPPPAPVEVESDSDGSTDDLSMFNFSGGGGEGGSSYGGYDPVEDRRASLNQNFWVMPVAIGTGGLVLLLIAFLLVSADPVVEPAETTKTEDKDKKKDDAKSKVELPPIDKKPEPKQPPKKIPTTLSAEALVDVWNSSKIQGDPVLTEVIRDRSIEFKSDGTFTQTTSMLKNGEEDGQRVVSGKFVLAGDALTITPDGNLPASMNKAELKLSGQMLVLIDEAQDLTVTYNRAAPVDPAVANQPPEPEVDPEPENVVWTVNDDPPEDGAPPFITATQMAELKPDLKVGCVGVSPDNTLVAFGSNSDGKIHVYNVDGTVVCSCDAKGDLQAVAVPSPRMIIAWSNQGMQVFDGQSGAATTQWDIPVSGRGELGMAVSGKGKYFAICRKGIRIYACEDGMLKGLIKTPKDQQEVAFSFSRDGKELIVIYQRTATPLNYRIVPHTLLTGQPDPDLTKERPGYIADTTGPLAVRMADQNRKYLFVGNKYVINGADGRIVSVLNSPEPVTQPLDAGNFYVANKDGSGRVAGIPFTRLDDCVRAFGQSVGGILLCPEDPANPVSVQVDARGSGNGNGIIKAKLERVLLQRLEADGMRIDAGASQRLVVTYTESPGPKATSLKYIDNDGQVQTKKYENPFTTYQAQITAKWSDLKPGVWTNPTMVVYDNITHADRLNGDPSKIFAEGLLENAAGTLSGFINCYFAADTPLDGTVQLPQIFGKLEGPNGAAPAAETPEANAL